MSTRKSTGFPSTFKVTQGSWRRHENQNPQSLNASISKTYSHFTPCSLGTCSSSVPFLCNRHIGLSGGRGVPRPLLGKGPVSCPFSHFLKLPCIWPFFPCGYQQYSGKPFSLFFFRSLSIVRNFFFYCSELSQLLTCKSIQLL